MVKKSNLIRIIQSSRQIHRGSAFLQQEKGLDLKEHIVEIEEMAELNNGGWRQVKSVMLSRTACIAIATNQRGYGEWLPADWQIMELLKDILNNG